jgi:hypothetical protein
MTSKDGRELTGQTLGPASRSTVAATPAAAAADCTAAGRGADLDVYVERVPTDGQADDGRSTR